jgi:hypothetical protein
MSEDFTQLREKLNEALDAGGCTEAWAAAQNQREKQSEKSDPAEVNLPSTSAKRRSVVKSISSIVASSTLIGTASSRVNATSDEPEDQMELSEKFDKQQAKKILDSHADDLLNSLAERGYIKEANAAGLEFDRLKFGGKRDRDTLRLATSLHPKHGKHVTLSTLLPANEFDRDIIVSIRPELSLATASADIDGQPHVLRADTNGFVARNAEGEGWCIPCLDCGIFNWDGEYFLPGGYVSFCGSCTYGFCWP